MGAKLMLNVSCLFLKQLHCYVFPALFFINTHFLHYLFVNTFSEVIERRQVEEPKHPSNLPCSSKQYQRLTGEMKKLVNVEIISSFLIEETKSRKVDRKKSLTKKLDQSDWRELREEVRKQIEKTGLEQNVKELKKIIMFWILYPKLKGQKPEKWSQVQNLLMKN
jgi:hypothetical protein